VSILRKIKDSKGEEITLELPDDWTNGIDLPHWAAKENFVKQLFSELKKFPECHTYRLISLSPSDVGDQYNIILCEKNNDQNMFMVPLKRAQYEQKHFEIQSQKLIDAHDPKEPLIRKDKMIMKELNIDEKYFIQWKKDADDLLIDASKEFAWAKQEIIKALRPLKKLQTHLKQTKENSSLPEFDIGYENDIPIKKAKQKIQHKINMAYKTMRTKLKEFTTLESIKLKLDNIAHGYYQEHIEKTGKLLFIRESILNILRQTAIDYYKKLILPNNTIDPTAEKNFNEFFKDIAQINHHQLFSEKINAELSLKHISALFNGILFQLNTFYNRWLDGQYNPLGASEPLVILMQYIEQFNKFQSAEKTLECKNFTFSIPNYFYQQEKNLLQCMEEIREQFIRSCDAVLAKERDELYDIVGSGSITNGPKKYNFSNIISLIHQGPDILTPGSIRKTLDYLARITFAIANYIEQKKPALAESKTVSPDTALQPTPPQSIIIKVDPPPRHDTLKLS